MPLRNLSFVTGFRYLPRLSDRVRVKRANSLVELMTTWCRALSARGVCWSIENPSNSLIWAYPGWRELVQAAHVVHFDACMFGSRRKKATAIVSNRTWFRRSGVKCSGDHPHESWGKARSAGRTVWATSLESAYTPELSRAWASCVATALCQELSEAPPTRKRKRKFLCEPDFDDRVILHADEAVPFMQMFPPCRVPKSLTKWPKGSRLLFLDESAGSAHLAVPCPPEIWCRRAADLAHPYSMERPLHADLNSAVSAETVSDPAALARRRTEECKSLSILCKSVEAEEMACRAGLHPDVQSVTSTKQSLALERLLHQLGHVDSNVASCVRSGFPLVGWLPCSGIWEPDCEPPVLSERALQEMAPDISERSVRNVCKHRDASTEQSVWDSTQEECSKGWLSFCHRASLSSSSVVSTRFGVQQKNKVRPIDNFKSSFVNSACGVREKVAMDGVDEIISTCLHWLRRKRPRHQDDRIVGRTWDLKSAYKQLAVRADHKKYAVICVVDPISNDVRFAKLHSMPFGALAAVHAFLRCGEALKFLGRKKLLLVMTNFFDDFTVLASYANSSHVQAVVSFMFRKLGWQVADEDKKNKPFAEVFDVLGVRVDLSRQHEGTVSVSNTPERIDELRDFVRQVLARGFITYEESQRLRGRFLFAEQHVWGRNSRQAVVTVGDVPPEASGWVRLTDTQVSALQFLQRRVLDGKPRIFSTSPRGELRLWIDGACEWDVPSNSPTCGFGGVLFIENKPVAWGCTLAADRAKKWAARVGKQQLVYECELLPYLISLQLWASYVKGTNLLTFIDNDAARASLAKSFTRKEEGARIVYDSVSMEENLDVQAFFFRVPTSSNIADGPSRGDFSLIEKLGGRRVQLPVGALELALGL